MANDTTIFRGDTAVFDVYLKDENGAVIDITNYTFYFTAKVARTDPDAQAIITKTVTSHVDPTQGHTRITLLNTDTTPSGTYYFDMKFKTAAGEVHTFNNGKLTITEDVSKRAA